MAATPAARRPPCPPGAPGQWRQPRVTPAGRFRPARCAIPCPGGGATPGAPGRGRGSIPREGQGFRAGPWGRVAFGWERRARASARSGAGQSWRRGWIGAGLALLLLLPLGGATATAATSGTWTVTGHMRDARDLHTALLLPGGQVLVAGGQGINGLPLASAELYDPASGTWSATGRMREGRMDHTAILLQDGRVLVAGGSNPPQLYASAELYTP